MHLWLRDEIKEGEKRAFLTPTTTEALTSANVEVTVESSTTRAFSDAEYESAGAVIAPSGSWVSAPPSAIVCALKELPEDVPVLSHSHIMFGHAYKNQSGWADFLTRFQTTTTTTTSGDGDGDDGVAGGLPVVGQDGCLLDLEYVVNPENGRRVAAFGYMAGYAGAALSLLAWAEKMGGGMLSGPIDAYGSKDELVSTVRAALEAVGGDGPRVMVMGALGRAGSGAVALAEAVGIDPGMLLKWDMAETAGGGPFDEIGKVDVFVNCIFLSSPIPPFVTSESLGGMDQDDVVLKVVCDVSCDTTNPHNPIPFANQNSTFANPVIRVGDIGPSGIDLVTIDNLPSLLPREASDEFADAMLPYLLALADSVADHSPLPPHWQASLDTFITFRAQAEAVNAEE